MRKPLKLKSDYLNALLDLAAQRTRERGDRVYGHMLGLSIRDIRALRLIAVRPGITMGELAEASALEKTLLSKLVASLLKRGLVAREIGARDARNIQLTLTDAGVQLVKLAEPLGKRLEAGFSQMLSDEEIQALHRILPKIIEAERATRGEFQGWIDALKAAWPPQKSLE